MGFIRKYYLWFIILIAVVFNHWFRYFLKHNTDLFYSLPIIENIRYADYLFQKWFLTLVAFCIFILWGIQRKIFISGIRENALQILIILFVAFGAHWFSYFRWFEFDDYRVIGHHYSVDGTIKQNEMGAGSSYYYGIGLVYLVVNWFGSQFELYNTLGLFIYFLIGVTIFFLVQKFTPKKSVALLISLFFVTSPTYWRELLLMLELLGDGFKLLLFAVSCYLLISRFYPGAVIFAAAALEFGISRTHFIALPLILISLFFQGKQKGKRNLVFSLIAFFVISFTYLQVLSTHPPKVIDYQNILNNIPQILRISDTVFSVTIPHAIAFPAIWFFRWLFNNYVYTSSILGGLISTSLLLFSVALFLKKRFLPAKLFFLGITTVVAAIIFPTLMGIRLVYKPEILTFQYDDIFPAAPTSYGVFSTFGTIFILLGLVFILRKSLFIKLMFGLIILNIITVVKSDIEWAKQYSTPQRVVNVHLNELLPYDGQMKVIYTPPPTQVLSRYISYFYQLYRIKDTLNFTNEPEEFIRLLEEYKPQKERVYLFTLDTKTNDVIDLSYKLREYYPEKKLTPAILKTFTQ